MKRKAIAWGPAVFWALGLFVLSELRAAPSSLQPLLAVPDKLVHFALYLTLGGLLARARWISGTDVLHAVLIAAGCGYAALDEWHQSFVPGRTPDVADWLADVAGVTVGYLIIYVARARDSRDPSGMDGG